MMSLKRLHLRRAVDVGQRDMVGVGLAERLELVGRAAVLEAAAGVHVGQDDDLFRRQDLRRLGHEADAAKGDHLGVGRGRLARQVEAVADEIGEVLDFGLLVIMGEDDRVALALQPLDLGRAGRGPSGCAVGRSFLFLRRALALALPRAPHYMGANGRYTRRLRSPSVGEARDHLGIVESRPRAAASRSSARPPVRAASRASRIGTSACACLRRSATARARLAWSSRLVGVGQRRQHPALAIFARRGRDRLRARRSRSRAACTLQRVASPRPSGRPPAGAWPDRVHSARRRAGSASARLKSRQAADCAR